MIHQRFRDGEIDYDSRYVCHFVATTAALIGAGLAAAGAIGGSVIQSHEINKAADTQATAAEKIAQDAKDASVKASDTVNQATTDANAITDASNTQLTDAQKQQLAALKPYIDAGTVSLSQVQQILSPNGELGTNSQFKFDPNSYNQNDPGYAYLQQQAAKAVLANGALGGFTGGTEKGIARVASSLASTHLDSAFNRELQTYQTNRQTVLDRLQGLQGITGLGFQATGVQNQDIGNTAQLINSNENTEAARKIAAGEYSGNVGLRATQIAADATAQKAAAQGAADIGTGNAIASGISGTLKAITPVLYSTPGSLTTGNSLSVNDSGQPIR